jgi:hypothetical protein
MQQPENILETICFEGQVFYLCGNPDDPTLIPGPVRVRQVPIEAAMDAEPIEPIVPAAARARPTPQLFPPELENFSFADRNCVLCGNEPDPKPDASEDTFEVAQTIVLTDSNGAETYSLVIDSLHSNNLRKLANMFGIRGQGSKSKWETRLAIAQKKSLQSRYNIGSLSYNNSSIDNTKNIVRVINGIFHPDNFETFLSLNDRKDRTDFEYGNGPNNVNFWALLADYVNDASNESLDSFRKVDNDTTYDEYVEKAQLCGYSPIGCSQQTGISCKSMIEGVVKIRGTIIANMTKSGQHANDPYLYVDVAIKRHTLVKTVSTFAAYYFFMCTSQHPDVDGVLKRYLSKSVKADSSTLSSDNKSRSYDKKKGDNDIGKLIEEMSGVREDNRLHLEDQKKRLSEAQKADSTTQYCNLKILMAKEPLLADDPHIKKRLQALTIKMAEPERSPIRKKVCVGSISEKSDDSSDVDDSIPLIINKGSTSASDSIVLSEDDED